jgi:hypothetical protein
MLKQILLEPLELASHCHVLESQWFLLSHCTNFRERKQGEIHIFISMHAKFMLLGMRVPHFIPNNLTKWHIQFLLILVVILFLGHTMLEF